MPQSFSQSLVIIPTYNEVDNVEKMITTIFSLYPQVSVLIIDDGSPDGTAAVVKGLMNDFKNLFIIERKGKLGLGTAYTTGFKWALERDFQYVFEMDCDFSHDPKQLADLLRETKTHDLIIGSRYIEGGRVINWPVRRLLLSYCASIFARLVTGIPLKDTTGGFKCFTRKALESLDLNKIMSNGYSFQLEVSYKIFSRGLKLKEVPIVFRERQAGQSKMRGGIIFEALFSVVLLRIKKTLGTL